jgi:bacteriocin-like protein
MPPDRHLLLALSDEPDLKEIDMSHDEKKTTEDTKKPEDSKEELSEAELDQVSGGTPERPRNPVDLANGD